MKSLTAERGWTLELPDGMYEVRVPPPPECTAMAHLRGAIADRSPVFGVLSTRARDGRTLEELATDLARSLMEPVRHPCHVPGSRHAARITGLIDMEEGLTADGIERIDLVIAQIKTEFVVLTVRTRPQDSVAESVAAILSSFSLERAAP